MTSEHYPQLANLLSGWFHQDFDLNGENVTEVVRAYQAVTPAEQQVALRAEISSFIAEQADDLDAQFDRIFQPDIIPSALSGSTHAFLTEIQSLLPTAA